MPIVCRLKRDHGSVFCATDCPAAAAGSAFEVLRIEQAQEVPAADPRTVDVAVLDMNHGWANLGHDSLVYAVQDAACDVLPELQAAGLRVRVLSFDVRRSGVVPAAPPRYPLYLGTGGPGHLDPHLNDGTSPGSQTLVEDPSWEAPAFALFDAIARNEEAALLAVCHTFGVLCRWSGAAESVLRPPGKGGKSAGILENVLTPEAQSHPWFSRLAEELPDHRRLRVVDHRLFDLIPAGPLPAGATAIGFETLGPGGPPGDALTMMEFARDAEGLPRVFGVNHHPEIVDRSRQRLILEQKRERGEVTDDWYQDRMQLLAQYPDEATDHGLHLTSDFTLLGPLRFHLYRALARRAGALGLPFAVPEAALPEPVRHTETRRP